LKIIKKLKSLPWFEIFIIIALLAINGYAAFSDAYNLPNNWFTRDDAYYYFKVAQNISEGQGSTFDGINPTNGYHPLWMLVCVPIFALARFDTILPLRILILVLAVLRAATSVLLYRLLKNVIARSIAMLAALYWGFNYYIHATAYQQGLETGLAAFCLILFLFLLQRFERARKSAPFKWRQIAGLGVTGTLVLFSRLDMVFLVVLFGLWIVFQNSTLRYLLPLDILILTISATSAFIIRTGLPEYYPYSEMAIIMLAINLIFNLILFYILGLYEHPGSHKPVKLIKHSVIAIGISTALNLAIMLGITRSGILPGSFPRTAPLIHGALSFILMLTLRLTISLFGHNKESQLHSPIERLKANWRKWISSGALYFGIVGGSLGLFMLWSKFTFGTSSPVSGHIKRWWGSFSSRVYGGSARSASSFFGIDYESDFNAWHPITTAIGNWHGQIKWMYSIPIKYDLSYALMLGLILIALVLLLLINRKRAARIINQLTLLPLLAGAELQIIQYNITGYSALKEWYWVSQMVFIILVGSLLLDILAQTLRRIPAANVLLYLIILIFGINSAQDFARITARQMPNNARFASPPYMGVVAFVEKHTPPGSLVGMTGGGNVGYFIRDRTIINMDGLINSFPYFQSVGILPIVGLSR